MIRGTWSDTEQFYREKETSYRTLPPDRCVRAGQGTETGDRGCQ